jgi:hypothetical protein
MLFIMVPIRVELENLLQLRSIDSYTGWHKGKVLISTGVWNTAALDFSAGRTR